MHYRQLGHSGIEVSEIGLGSWLTYSGGVEAEVARDCVFKALDCGINFVDTANVYGQGAAESFLGQVLADVPRDSYVLATKLYFPMSETDRGLSRQQILKQIDASLARLNTDYVDLYQCHRFDEDTPLEETMEALGEVLASGKARAIGFSEWSPAQISAALAMEHAPRFTSSQPQYSLLWREPEREVMPLCQANGIGQVVWSPLAQGVLTGKYRPGQPPPGDSRAANPAMNQFMGRWRQEALLEAVQGLRGIADAAGLSMAQLALAWVLRRENVSSAIIGASRPEQISDNARAAGVSLGTDLLDAVDRCLADVAG